MTFSEATDQLMAQGVSLQEIADALGVAYTTVRAMRLDPTSASFRRPPPDSEWRPALRSLTEQRGDSFRDLAARLR